MLLFPIERVKTSYPWIALILAVSGLLIGLILFLHRWKGIPIADLLRDPNATAGNPSYTGCLSQIGIFFWSAAAAICLFSAKTLTLRPEGLEIKRFLSLSALLTLLLGLDDAFLLHEQLFPVVGLSEKKVFIGYGILLLFILVRFCRIIVKTEFILLGMALFFFTSSLAIDHFQNRGFFIGSTYRILYEDGTKMAGILSWLIYFFRVGEYAVYCHADHDHSSRKYE